MKSHANRMRMRAINPRATAADVTTADITRLDVPQPGSTNFDLRVRETLMTYLGKQGDYLDRGITVRDLLASGIVTLPPGWTPGGGGGGGGIPPFVPVDPGEIDLTPPPDVAGFVVTPGISVVFFETDPPAFTQGHGYLRTHVYGKAYNPATDPLPTFADAQEIYSFTGEIGSMATEPLQTLRVWAKWETRDGVLSVHPVGGTNGIEVTTGQDVDALVAAMTGPGNPFKIVTEPILLPDGTYVPEGVYISDAYIHAMQVSTAMIRDAAITNAKVQSLAADKITAGKIRVGEYISSSSYVPGGNVGWIINGADDAIFNNVTARGNIFASGGAIGGAIIGVDSVQSTGYIAGQSGWRIENSTGNTFFNTINARGSIKGGSFTGYNWPPAGQSGYYLGPEGLLLGNNNDGKYFQFDVATGNLLAPQFSITGGNATFSGMVQAATIKASKISVGEAGTPVTFYDDAFPNMPLRSVAHGSYLFDTVTTGGAVVTGPAVKFLVGEPAATNINLRLRTGTVRFLITAFSVADHFFSIWVRVNSGAWTFLNTSVETKPSDGAVSVGFAGQLTVAAADVVEFGMSATDSTGATGPGGSTDLRYASLNVLAFNF